MNGDNPEPTEVSMTNFKNYDSMSHSYNTKAEEVREIRNVEPEGLVPVKGKYPKIVFLIILNEFCERYILSLVFLFA